MLNNELEIIKFWRDGDIFQKSLLNRRAAEPFIFFDGPPFATGTPHWGHILVSQIKDTVARYQTQKGFYVPRRWGWDCHGSPIEVLAEKGLGIRDKRQIEGEVGIEKFNNYCRSKIMMYDEEWRRVIERIGRWVDMDDQYRTMDNDFIESVWWGLGQLWNKGLVYKGYRISMYSPSVGVPLTHTDVSMEVEYQNETIDSPIVRFQCKPDSIAMLLDQVLEQVNANYDDQFKIKTELENRISNITNPGVKKATREDILNQNGADNKGVKLNQNTQKEIEELGPQLEMVMSNLDSLLTIKNALKKNCDVNLLAWTTTPWTLPSNTGLAVGSQIEYSMFFLEKTSEIVILAENLAIKVLSQQIDPETLKNPELIEELKGVEDSGDFFDLVDCGITKIAAFEGKDLVGLYYKPLFKLTEKIDDADELANFCRVHPGDEFANDQDGTGIVHMSPCYGEPEFELRKSRNFPLLHSLNSSGEILDTLDEELRPAFGKSFLGANPIITDIVKEKGNLFGTIRYTHRVPVYGRDGKKVYYCAQEGWYIAETKLKARSIELNNEINWFPAALKHGRFEKGLESAPDWCISRNRYWGAPIPIWQTDDQEKSIFINSMEEIKEQAVNPIYKIINSRDLNPELYKDGQTAIFTDLTAKLPLGISAIQHKSKNLAELAKIKNLDINNFSTIAQKILNEIIELFPKYNNVQIFFGDKEQTLWTTWLEMLHPDSKKNSEVCYFYQNVEMGITDYEPVGEIKILDLHRPFIDDILLRDKDGLLYTRITEVLDCWVESGSMPHASIHYPFAGKHPQMPTADWIAEAQDQTRGWFRALHVMSTGIFDKPAYKNINCSGLIMAKDGQKMSKSKNNFADPNELMEKYGADAVRLYMLSSPVVNGESLSFLDRSLETTFRESTLLLVNSIQYLNHVFTSHPRTGSRSYVHPLNKWLHNSTQEFVHRFESAMNEYNISEAARLIVPYIDDLSTWYIRRTKDILTDFGGEVADCLQENMEVFAKTIACIQPFNAERIWSVVRSSGSQESVHLTDFPKLATMTEKQTGTLIKMKALRDMVSQIHSARKIANHRVRQPLYVNFAGLDLDENYVQIVTKECNLIALEELPVDSIKQDIVTELGTVELSLSLDDKLTVLGFARDLERSVQDFRKKQGFKSGQVVIMKWRIVDFDEDLFGRVVKAVDWSKLNVDIKWDQELDEGIDKIIEVKNLAKILVEM
jgi:isoleucyl-tRNA synthetase